jgi:hypothetical protein
MMMTIVQQLWGHGQGLAERFGAKVVIGCAAFGCLLPIGCIGGFLCGVLFLLMEWR